MGGWALKRRHGRRRSRKIVLVYGAVGLLLVCVFLGALWFERHSQKPETRGSHTQRYEFDELIEHGGVTYRELKDMTTILVMGIDKSSPSETDDIMDFRDGGQADFLRLIAIDPRNKEVIQIPIDRDTLATITIRGVLGDVVGKRTAQIALSHSFGDGREQSCQYTVESVSGLMMDLDIDFYISVGLEGIGAINDWAGGITLTLDEDFSDLDPAMVKGATLTLNGEQAERYVRGRYRIGQETNEARMRRQQIYIDLLTDAIESRIYRSQEDIGSLYDAMEPYMVTDMPRGRLINELWAAKEFEKREPVTIPGEHKVSQTGYMQFYADEEKLQQLVLDLFYEPVELE